MLNDAADIIQAILRQIGILVASEQGLAAFPDRLVHVHPTAIVLEIRLRHEGCGLAISCRYILDHIFVEVHIVGHFGQRLELQAKLMLSRGHFVVMLLRLKTQFLHHLQHFTAQVLRGVDWANWEVAALWTGAMTHIATFIDLAGVVRQFGGVEAVARIVGIGVPAHVVKDEEFRFWAEIGGVTHAARLQIGFSALADAAWATVVWLQGAGDDHVADDGEGGLLIEGVQSHAVWIWQHDHVGVVDGLPARD